MKKRILAGMLIALAVCSVTACGKNKKGEASVVSGSVITSEAEGAETQSAASQTPETSSQTPETSSQTPETSSQTPETPSQTASAQTVSAGISLEEDMASVSYVLLARMISEQEDSVAFDAKDLENGDTFWKEMNYLISAYGVNNKKITFDEESKEYTLKKAQLRYYAAALYSDLGKAKKLPGIAEGSTSVAKSGSKWKFAMSDISGYEVSVQSCAKEDKSTYRLTVCLVDAASQTSLGEYAAVIKKSAYTGSKSPFHYAVVSLDKMTKMSMETVLVGDRKEEEDSTQAGLTASPQTGGTQPSASGSSGDSSSQYGQVLSMPGTSTDASQSSQGGDASPSGADTPQTGADAAQTPDSDISGATITSDAAMEIARNYYGTKASDGTEYQYTYEGTTTYQNVPYYNFAVSDGENTVINVLVSGDGARIYKGTQSNGSWTMQ